MPPIGKGAMPDDVACVMNLEHNKKDFTSYGQEKRRMENRLQGG